MLTAWWMGLLLGSPVRGQAQAVTGILKLKKFPSDVPWVYPYESMDADRQDVLIGHDPAIQVAEGEFVHVWRPELRSMRARIVRKYNLLMEILWETEVELDDNETIEYLFRRSDTLCMLTYQYRYGARAHIFQVRPFMIGTGEALPVQELWQLEAPGSRDVFATMSADQQALALYYFDRKQGRVEAATSRNEMRLDGTYGLRVYGADRVKYRIFTGNMTRFSTGEVELPGRKFTVFDCQPDGAGNLYVTGYEKKAGVRVFFAGIDSGAVSSLFWDDFPRVRHQDDPYITRFVPYLGRDRSLYLACADRVPTGPRRGIKAFRVARFDFARQELDLRREVEVTSTLLVNAEKQRQAAGLRPLRRFDEFLVREVIERPDGTVWFVAQKYHVNSYSDALPAASRPYLSEEETEEMIWFEFSPEGSLTRVMFVPMAQVTRTYLERLGQFYSLTLTPDSARVRIVSWEPEQQGFTGPERIFYREIDLDSARVSPRVMLFEGKRRSQFLLSAYTEWLSEDLISLVLIDGEQGDAWSVCVNIRAKPEEESEENRRRRRE
ncbi:MAG: hypothetical protein SF053_20595 [Bacteroidia bacterium]|nr:hypothetical protein [Bacteroidia bacterium]